MIFQRESPHWLITQGREDEARRSLRRLRVENVEPEIREVKELSRRSAGVRELLAPSVRPLLQIGVLLAIFQQITGINPVIYYAPTLLKGAGLGNSAALLAEVLGPVFRRLIAEIYPLKIRGAAMSVATVANWAPTSW